MSQQPLIDGGHTFSKQELKKIVDTCLHYKRAKLPESVRSLQDFINGIGLQDAQKGLNTMDAPAQAKHLKKYGSNTISNRNRLKCRIQGMPFYYVFLFGIVGVIFMADKYLYEYKFWYIQGSAMALMVIIAACVFGCDRVRVSKRENLSQVGYEPAEIDDSMQVKVLRNGMESVVELSTLTVGDIVHLQGGDIIPADCAIMYTQDGQGLLVEETMITGEPELQLKRQLMGHHNSMVFNNETVVFAQSRVSQGDAHAIVIAVGDSSSAAVWIQNREIEEDAGEENDLIDKHRSILQIFICFLILGAGLLLIQTGIHKNIDWITSGNIALMMFGYGFPYILSIPAIWDKALRNTTKHLEEGNIKVQYQDSIEEVASLDYLCVQTISILDKKEDYSQYRRCVQTLQDMGIKVILATGIGRADAVEIAIEVGILKKEHENICGAVIEGADLRSIYNGRKTKNMGDFDITPEYLSVVFKATSEDRCTLVDYLSKVHPGRMTCQTPMSIGSEENLRLQPPVATVGAIGSGDNDVKMLQKAKISFSTSQASTPEATKAADMILLTDSLADVVMAVTKGRQYKDHLLKFVLMQIPCSVTAIGFVLTQVFLYKTILVTGAFIFLINLIYFPIGIACIVRENAESRYTDMIGRWRSVRYPGTKTITGYMRAEYLKFSIFIVTLFQVGAMYGLYYHADKLMTLVHQDLDWDPNDPLYVDEAWFNDPAHNAADHGYEINDLTDKGKMFLILFQTFAFLQIFNIFNARRPSYKDLNPFEGISALFMIVFTTLLAFQFAVCAIPVMFGYGTIELYTNLICLGLGICSAGWFTVWKAIMLFVLGGEDMYPSQV